MYMMKQREYKANKNDEKTGTYKHQTNKKETKLKK
jgi:hypothetical protein